jgi:hypothetical protein
MTSAPVAIPSYEVLDTLERRLLHVWRRDEMRVADPDGLARLIRLLLRDGLQPAAEVLDHTGIRAQWNQVFAEKRSRFVASWVAGHLRAPVLDVLGGDFTLLAALTEHGFTADQLTGCERAGAYETDWSALPFTVHDVPEDVSLPPGQYGSVLVSTVLHHEPDLERLLEAICRTGARRWVVVENCLDAENDEAFHRYVDEFFNRCLNTFDVACTTQHRTAAQWRRLLGEFGTLTFEETRHEVPGMPFPYTLFVVDR